MYVCGGTKYHNLTWQGLVNVEVKRLRGNI